MNLSELFQDNCEFMFVTVECRQQLKAAISDFAKTNVEQNVAVRYSIVICEYDEDVLQLVISSSQQCQRHI